MIGGGGGVWLVPIPFVLFLPTNCFGVIKYADPISFLNACNVIRLREAQWKKWHYAENEKHQIKREALMAAYFWLYCSRAAAEHFMYAVTFDSVCTVYDCCLQLFSKTQWSESFNYFWPWTANILLIACHFPRTVLSPWRLSSKVFIISLGLSRQNFILNPI